MYITEENEVVFGSVEEELAFIEKAAKDGMIAEPGEYEDDEALLATGEFIVGDNGALIYIGKE